MNHLEATRRFLELKDLDEVLSECRSLHQMGYRRMGKWSLAQICRHLRMTFDSSIDRLSVVDVILRAAASVHPPHDVAATPSR